MRTLMMSTVVAALVGTAMTTGVQAQDAQVERGKYLVEQVVRCQDCHTTKTESGELDTAKWLKGGKLDFQPIGERKGWHPTAPDLTSTSSLWARWGEDGMVKFLETAKNPRGNKADAPMPAYTMHTDDAKAIVAYLLTLK